MLLPFPCPLRDIGLQPKLATPTRPKVCNSSILSQRLAHMASPFLPISPRCVPKSLSLGQFLSPEQKKSPQLSPILLKILLVHRCKERPTTRIQAFFTISFSFLFMHPDLGFHYSSYRELSLKLLLPALKTHFASSESANAKKNSRSLFRWTTMRLPLRHHALLAHSSTSDSFEEGFGGCLPRTH